MSVATFIPWENPLAAIVKKPGGVRVGDALKKAGDNLDTIRESCLGAVDLQLEQLDRLCGEGGLRPTDTVKLEIYQLSNDVYGVAGVFGLAELGLAAFSLCEMVDGLRTTERWSQPAVEVHLSAFRLLRHLDPDTDRSSILEGLRALNAQIDVIAR